MARKRKKVRKNNCKVQKMHKNLHHCCWQSRYWDKPQAKRLRSLFTESIDIDLHHYIHANLNNIPTPPENVCSEALKRFQGVCLTGLIPKIIWLAENVEYPPFQEAMWRQYYVVLSYKSPSN